MSMNPMQTITTNTSDNLVLNGAFYEGDKDKSVYVYLHGYTDTYKNNVLAHKIAEKLQPENHSVLLPQLRGSGNISVLKTTDGKEIKTGSYYELLEEAHLDISAWISTLLKLGYSQFVLIGHSLGTIKAVRYLFEGEYKEKITKLVLLSPYDKNGYLEGRHPLEWKGWVNECKLAVDQGNGRAETPAYFDDDAMSYQTYYSWYNDSELSRIFDFYKKEYDFPVLNLIQIPVVFIVGEEDEFVYIRGLNKDIEEVKSILKKNISNCSVQVVANAGHTFDGCEEEVASIVYAESGT